MTETFKTHGATVGKKTSEYKTWLGIKERCFNPNSKFYKDYGGRGITMCDRWNNSFSNFLADVGPRPPNMTIDRKDNNGNYKPGNCRWATKSEQSNNRRDNRILELGDQKMTMSQWAEKTGIKVGTIWARLDRGWPPYLALTK